MFNRHGLSGVPTRWFSRQSSRQRLLATAAAVVASCVASAGGAQTSAVAEAEDAFGQRVDDETVGLYNETQVRGFNLENAGNYRLDDTYFVRSGQLPSALVEGSMVRVGASALGINFPAPSGLVEFSLRRPGEGRLGVETTAGVRWGGSPLFRANGWGQSSNAAATILGGFEISPGARYPDGTEGSETSFGTIGTIRAGEIMVQALFGGVERRYNGDYAFFPTEPALPAPLSGRYVMFGPQWGKFKASERLVGGTASWRSGFDLEVNLAYFHNWARTPATDFTTLELLNAQQARATIFQARDQRSNGSSGELKVTKRFVSGVLDHELVLALRTSRDERVNTAGEARDLGIVNLEERDFGPPVQPAGNATYALTRSRQTGYGLTYRATFRDFLRLRVGALRTDYRKTVDVDMERNRSSQSPWLFDGAVSIAPTPQGLLYASYVKGLEEAGVAPKAAVNRNEVLPAIIAEQLEFGFRYSFDKLTAIGSVFEISKPTTGFDPTGRFGLIGRVRHRGVEFSLSGAVSRNLNVTVGAVFLEPRVSGEIVDDGLAARQPLGVASQVLQASGSYALPLPVDVSVDAIVTHTSSVPADQLDRFRIPPKTTLDLGAQYTFVAAGLSHSLRFRVQDLFGRARWRSAPGGALSREQPRSLSLQLTSLI
ncbi:MAG: TonB-dependent receptor [Alphaproteobacteria bacterium]|nr:TonB-dependent receptor [Alphaproteobacteria bacterium]MBU0792574.1 TonB-dependent receptor [Alphaproteobacteria bacterium]MBU0874783.1 TonB-dependent receptor [Alphaproteobacteria bacterium]MBU1768641.1 TonB-dependent receptor [Alphaproteobacteria bacterium]